MTHGDKEKAKKAASKASGDKKSKAVTPGKAVQTAGKTIKSGKTGKESGGKAVQSKAGEKAAAPAKAGNDKPKARAAAEPPGSFSNPLVASGFKRALKKFPTAFRRLTD